ncbi:MAG TPA: D-alanyl-D-alanine carboxypeptidase [Clostridiaceae bacterium]|nr:D-alanyl-D-alanine carboxypeptidase [Clostridiaceae bacterium]
MKRLLAMALILLVFLLNFPLCCAAPLNIEAEAYILMDIKSGQVLCEKDSENKKLYPASTTKIMTAIVALENSTLDTMMTASQAAVYDIGKDGMNIGIMPGEVLSLEQLLHALLIVSANEAANIIAENVCDTRQEFIDLMNKRAQELGAKNTHFVNANGMHDNNHYTTAKDMALIAKHAMNIPEFREIVSKTEYTPIATNKHPSWPTLYSSNKLLRFYNDSELFEVTGIKTGYTGPAGFNLVSSGKNNEGMELLSVILGVSASDNKDSVYKYSRQLLEYGFENYSIQSLVRKGQVIKTVQVDPGTGTAEDLNIVADNSISAVLPVENYNASLNTKEYIKPRIEVPVYKGDILGYLEYENNGITLGRVNLVASKTIEKVILEKTSTEKIKEVFTNPVFLKVAKISTCVIIGFALLRFTLRRISRRYRRRVRRRYY